MPGSSRGGSVMDTTIARPWWALDGILPLERASSQCDLIFSSIEAQNVYLENWTPIYPYISRDFAEYWKNLRRSGHAERLRLPTMYFNPKIDTLYIGPNKSYDRAQNLIPQLMEIECLTSLRFLAIDFRAICENSCSKKFWLLFCLSRSLSSFLWSWWGNVRHYSLKSPWTT